MRARRRVPTALRLSEGILDGSERLAAHSIGKREQRHDCEHCGAERWEKEKTWGQLCCLGGKCVLPTYKMPDPAAPPPELVEAADVQAGKEKTKAAMEVCSLWESDHPHGVWLRKFARSANSSFSMASQPLDRRFQRPAVPGGAFQPCLVMHGQVNHVMGPLEMEGNAEEEPRYAQVYVLDAAFRKEDTTARTHCRIGNISWPSITTNEVLTRRVVMDYLFVRTRLTPACPLG